MSHGSAFYVAALAVVDALAPLLPSWQVAYDEPRDQRDLKNDIGAAKAVWVDSEGSSTLETFSLGMNTGYQETCTVTLIFQHYDENGAARQSDVDAEVATATGELLDLLSADPKLGGDVRAEGWALSWVTVAGVTREGGLIGAAGGRGRRCLVELEARSMRCS